MTEPRDGTSSDPVVSVEWLHRRMAEDGPGLRIFDVRFDLLAPDAGRQSYLAGHIPGASHLDLDHDLAGPRGASGGRHPLPDPDTLTETLRGFGVGRETDVVFYDEGASMYAARAWWLMEYLGHSRTHVLDGGFAAWQAAAGALASGDADEVRARSGPRGDFQPRPRPDLAVNAEAVERLSRAILAGDRQHVLLDARAAERYRGDAEPLDRAAGHIPGAGNRPWSENYGPDGRWRGPDELARQYADLRQADEVVLYCGSGVSACVDVLAMRRTGFENVRLYPGSWSEWSSDPSQPVARGVEEGRRESG